jgi:hypothetical protein
VDWVAALIDCNFTANKWDFAVVKAGECEATISTDILVPDESPGSGQPGCWKHVSRSDPASAEDFSMCCNREELRKQSKAGAMY